MTGFDVAWAAVIAAIVQAAPARGVVVGGRVIDAASATPISGAIVELTPAARRASTDAAGRFEFPSVAAGRYRLVVSFGDRQVAAADVDVGDAPVRDVTIAVARGAPSHVESVTVTAGVAGDPSAEALRRSLDREALGGMRTIASDDPMRALQALPGAATADDFQSLFSMRGSAFRHLGVVVDGVPATELLHVVHAVQNPASIAMVNTDTVRRAALHAGPQPAPHGEWIGPTLEFDIRDGARDRVRGLALVSGTAASALGEGPIGARGSWLVSFRRSYLDWLIRTVEPEFDSTIGFYDGTMKLAIDLTPAQRLEVLAIAGDAVYRERDVGQTNALQRADSSSTVGVVSWRRVAPRWVASMRVALAGSNFRNLGNAGQEIARGFSQSLLWRGDLAVTLPNHWTVEAGLHRSHARMNEILRAYVRDRGGLRVVDERDVSPRTRRSSGWMQLSRRTASGSLVAGLRVSDRTISTRTVALPWIAAEHRAGPIVWTASAGMAAQYPDPRLVPAPETASQPELARSLEAGVGWETGTVRWRAAGFYRRETDVLVRADEARLDTDGQPVVFVGFPVARGALDGRTRGVDVVVSRRSPLGLDGWIGYTWSHTRMTDELTGETFDGDFDQRHTLNAALRYAIGTASQIGASLRVGSNVPVVGYFEADGDRLFLASRRNAARLPVYARLDVRANRAFRDGRLTMFVEVLNVLGRRNFAQGAISVRPDLQVLRFSERLIPRVPSAGLLIAF